MKSLPMKSFYTLLLMLGIALSQPIVANPISAQQAKQNALAFLQEHGKSMTMSSMRQAPVRSTAMQATAPFYIFNIGSHQGYVIASGDDCTPAVLGYSDNGYIDVDDIPCNLQAWLDGYARQIQLMQEQDVTGLGAPKEIANHPAIAPMLTCHWNQGGPYNMSCPIDPATGTRCLTGCVATAMAQVMYYHRSHSINYTTAVIPGYTTYTQQIHVNAIPAGSVINWENMIDEYGPNATESQKQAVANLMKYCGTAVEMDYAADASSASLSGIANSLPEYFNYSFRRKEISRSAFSDEDWEELMYSELSASRPVIYSGNNGDIGHAFVLDGYDGSGFYHINWGWGGTSDGYFRLTATDVSDNLLPYSISQMAIINAKPYPSVPDPDAGIHFMDPIMKNVCLSNWDENDDGVFSMEEAAAVSSFQIGDMKTTQTIREKITSFDEFQYFTGVKAIDNKAFYQCENLKSITIPTSVTSIGDYAFSWCTSLNRLTIPEQVVSIGRNAFNVCTGLKSVDIPNTVTAMGDFAFSGCTGLTSITIPESLTDIGNRVFGGCTGLTNVNILNSDIGTDMFSGCTGLTRVTIPATVTSIGSWAFKGCVNLKTVVWNTKNLMPHSTFGFVNIPVEQLIFGEGIELIPNGVSLWWRESLKSVTIPNSVTTIDMAAFLGCQALTSVTIGNGVTSIGVQAFDQSPLATVTCLSLVPPGLDYSAFESSYATAILRVPASAVSAYQSAWPWCYFQNIVGIDPSLGDVNMDGEVNVADINAVIDRIIGGSGDCLSNLMSDVNSDREVNIADINTVINLILNK